MAEQLTVAGVPVYRDSAGVLREVREDGAVAALRSDVQAVAATIPQPAETLPQPEKTGASMGAMDSRYARADHQHPRLTSTTYGTLGTDGSATIGFTRSFLNKPGVVMTEVEAAGKAALVCSVQTWVQDANGFYTGCVIRGQRAQTLPTINALSGALTLLSAVITGVNGLVAALTNYNVFGGSAAGAIVSVIAVARSDVPST